MLTMEKTELTTWMEKAFRGDLPEEVEMLLRQRETDFNLLTEMMTQWPASIKEPMDHLVRLQQADTQLMYAVIEKLFTRHLESHP